MNWVEVSIKTTGEAVEAISEILNNQGANGVVINDPSDLIIKDDESIIWDYIDEVLITNDPAIYVRAYYPEDDQINQKIQNIKLSLENIKNYLDVGQCLIELKKVNDEDWANEWKKHYKPLRIGEKILIIPSWENAVIEDGDIVIKLDPGMAFGTGTHETTKMCIQLLESHSQERNSLLDVGCGSGILSIIGAKLGFNNALGIDIDPIAIKVAEENAIRNNVHKVVKYKQKIIQDLEIKKYNIVIANIVADVIIDITPTVKGYLSDNGLYIISGIIKDRLADVKSKLLEENYDIVEEITMGEWVAMIARCQNSL